MAGRPSAYTQEIGDEICERLSEGESLRSICSDEHIPSKSAVFRWLYDNEPFRDQYTRAREMQADVLFDEMLHIADNTHEGVKTKTKDGSVETQTGDMIDHRRLQIDARKWILGRMSPKKYGDKVTNVHEGGEKPIETRDVSDLDRAKAMAMLATKATLGDKSAK